MAQEVTIQLNDESPKVPSGMTVKKALQFSEYRVTKFSEKTALFVPG
jgi:sulfur carrier protein ThiS